MLHTRHGCISHGLKKNLPVTSCTHKCSLWTVRCTACCSDVVIKTPASHLKLQLKCYVCFPLNAGPLRFSFSTKPFWSCCWLQNRHGNSFPMEAICSCGGEEVERDQSPLCKCQKWGGGLMTLVNHTFYSGPSTASCHSDVLFWSISVSATTP